MTRCVFLVPDRLNQPFGGIMNLVRHAQVAARQGAVAVVATDSGRDPHGRRWFTHELACIPWAERRPDDLCIVPDIFSDRADEVRGRCIVYLQTPLRLERNFDWLRGGLELWTDSPPMVSRCAARYPGRPARLVPNVVDPLAFPFIEQSRRVPGLILVFPRKGGEFIEETIAAYRAGGGRYWKARRVDRVRFERLCHLFREAQAFLASAEVEGCALPPQESMAAGVVVVGRNAGGANFCMRDRETALVVQTPQEAAAALRELEDPALRDRLARAAHESIRRFFPDAEPAALWREVLGGMREAVGA